MHTSEPEHQIALADRLSFQLYAASRALIGAYRQQLREFGLSFPQYLTLRAVWRDDGQTVSELCEKLELDSGTVSPLLVRLEAMGYVVRGRAGADGRQVQVCSTELGLGLQERVRSVPGAVAASVGLTEQGFGEMCGQLRELRAGVGRP